MFIVHCSYDGNNHLFTGTFEICRAEIAKVSKHLLLSIGNYNGAALKRKYYEIEKQKTALTTKTTIYNSTSSINERIRD